MGSLLLLLGLAWSVPATAQSDEPVLVLPFTNLSSQPTDTWIGIGIADSLTVDLENLGLSVLSGPVLDETLDLLNSSTRVPGDRILFEAGMTVGAQWVIVGAYQRVGDVFRLTARLIDVKSASVRQGFKIDGPVLDLFGLQDQIPNRRKPRR